MRYFPLFLVLLCFVSSVAWAGLEIGRTPERVQLQGELGGHLDNSAWSSDEFKGKVSVVFYVDPDLKDLNNTASEALKKEDFSLENFQSFGIINMAATGLPNIAVSFGLKVKQKCYPDTIYVRDYKKTLVEKWGISDHNNNVLAFDKGGRLIFRKDGKLNAQEIDKLLQAIRRHLNE